MLSILLTKSMLLDLISEHVLLVKILFVWFPIYVCVCVCVYIRWQFFLWFKELVQSYLSSFNSGSWIN